MGSCLGVSFAICPLPSQSLGNTGTWLVKNSLSISRRLPPLVAMGTVIFIITPWMGKKPRFCTCSQSDRDREPAGTSQPCQQVSAGLGACTMEARLC